MDDLQASDELSFLPEQVEPMVFKAVEAVLKDKVYSELLIQGWVDEICSKIIKTLVDMNKPFKYLGNYFYNSSFYVFNSRFDIVSCVIQQKNGAGLHLGHSCYWDSSYDNAIIVKWPSKDPNARLICIVSVYGLSY